MRTHAVEEDDHWILNGQKTYISNGINCDLVVVAAKTDPQNNPHAMTLFLVEAEWEGFERGRARNPPILPRLETASSRGDCFVGRFWRQRPPSHS